MFVKNIKKSPKSAVRTEYKSWDYVSLPDR